jgi:hypothetical protein
MDHRAEGRKRSRVRPVARKLLFLNQLKEIGSEADIGILLEALTGRKPVVEHLERSGR